MAYSNQLYKFATLANILLQLDINCDLFFYRSFHKLQSEALLSLPWNS